MTKWIVCVGVGWLLIICCKWLIGWIGLVGWIGWVGWIRWVGWVGLIVDMFDMVGFLVATMIGFFLELNVPPKKQFEPSVFGL